MLSSHRIPLRVSNRKAYVWDVNDIATLRSQHHICGILTGTLPHLSQQNVFLGVPLLLLPEEVVLLVENQVAVLIDDVNAHHDPSSSELQFWNEERLRNVNQQLSLAEQKEAQEAVNPGRAMSETAIRKRKEREERRLRTKNSGNATGAVHEEEPGVFVPSIIEPAPHPAAMSATSASTHTPNQQSTASYTVTIPASSSTLEWYAATSHSYATISAAREAGVWEYPATPTERARCGIFRGLWEQGYFMGGGIKFGGEYLVYPGDPLRYHSHFAASIIDSPTAPLRPMEIVAHGRLGTGTKKAHLLCEWNEEKKEASYFSIEWAGFG
ncbi:tRNA-intron endonuclease catalytic domain-like protein [Hygrophoropsis aurantiaca]|uniref:tRNA-intron endonuclease catalytic domain-like protein n=1 Tax=Hygrophoropsis aurantiaca TaxID=72124 RepID=A0ACB8AGV5_9AGAM|nr:tRNA-intron endonuclease catalytic domain-like protein [Hygrophoropsis aurantiaca]